MRQVESFVEIDAPPAVVWEVLLEFDTYPEWNPFIRSIEGIPIKGRRLEIRIEPPESRGMTFRPEVVVAEENRRLAWLGRLVVPFVFDGYHEFHLEPIADGERSGESRPSSEHGSDGGERTRLLQRETFRGALVPVVLDRDRIRRGFEAMNGAVKERAENRVKAAA